MRNKSSTRLHNKNCLFSEVFGRAHGCTHRKINLILVLDDKTYSLSIPTGHAIFYVQRHQVALIETYFRRFLVSFSHRCCATSVSCCFRNRITLDFIAWVCARNVEFVFVFIRRMHIKISPCHIVTAVGRRLDRISSLCQIQSCCHQKRCPLLECWHVVLLYKRYLVPVLTHQSTLDCVTPKISHWTGFVWINTTFGWFNHSSAWSWIGQKQGRYCFGFTLFSFFFSDI
jgi:hypothetical protein